MVAPQAPGCGLTSPLTFIRFSRPLVTTSGEYRGSADTLLPEIVQQREILAIHRDRDRETDDRYIL